MCKLKIQYEEESLSDIVEKFLHVKEAQHCSSISNTTLQQIL